MKIYNSLSNRYEEFNPNKEVTMYVCGATVYNDMHIGNARPIIFFNAVRNYFKMYAKGCKYVSNITDIDDKIIKKALEQGVSEEDIANKYIVELNKVVDRLGIKKPDLLPQATHYIKEMITYIHKLITLGYAYITDTGVYFRVSKLDDYGILSNQELDRLNEGAKNIETKEDSRDFALWKKTKEGRKYSSDFGEGRPGWHTECAVMNHMIFAEKIDIHGGGIDLKFPHHENEIAQTKAVSGHHLAKIFMHVGHLNASGNKMSKSIGNVVFLKDLLDKYSANAFKLLILSAPYRQPISYTEELMVQFQREYDRINRIVKKTFFLIDYHNIVGSFDNKILDNFTKAMEDDFNTANALSALYEIIKNINKEKNLEVINSLYMALIQGFRVLGIEFVFVITATDKLLYGDWLIAKNNKNFAEADRLRKILSLKDFI